MKNFNPPVIEDSWNDNILLEATTSIDEISIVASLTRDDSKILNLFFNASQIADLQGFPIFRIDIENQSVFLLGTTDDPKAHLITQNNSGFHWCMELRSYQSGKGYGGALLIWVVRNIFKQMFLDREMTKQAVGMIEKLIASKLINASIVDIKNGTLTSYNPDNDETIPMYDQPFGKRPALSKSDATNFTWMLETRTHRKGILQQYTRRIM